MVIMMINIINLIIINDNDVNEDNDDKKMNGRPMGGESGLAGSHTWTLAKGFLS